MRFTVALQHLLLTAEDGYKKSNPVPLEYRCTDSGNGAKVQTCQHFSLHLSLTLILYMFFSILPVNLFGEKKAEGVTNKFQNVKYKYKTQP